MSIIVYCTIIYKLYDLIIEKIKKLTTDLCCYILTNYCFHLSCHVFHSHFNFTCHISVKMYKKKINSTNKIFSIILDVFMTPIINNCGKLCPEIINPKSIPQYMNKLKKNTKVLFKSIYVSL